MSKEQTGTIVSTIKELRESTGKVSFKGIVEVVVFNPPNETSMLQSIKVKDDTGVIVLKSAIHRCLADTRQGCKFGVKITGKISTSKTGSKSLIVSSSSWERMATDSSNKEENPKPAKKKQPAGEADFAIRYMMREKCHVMKIVEEVLREEDMLVFSTKIPEFATSIMISLERSGKDKLILPAYDDNQDDEEEEPKEKEPVSLKKLFSSLKKKIDSFKGKAWYSFETKKGTLAEVASSDPFELFNWYWLNKSMGKETDNKKIKKLISNIEDLIKDTGFYFVVEAIAFDVMAMSPSGSKETDYEVAEKIIAGHLKGKSLEDIGEAWFGQTEKAKKKIITAYAA